jgi:hypothetical protein
MKKTITILLSLVLGWLVLGLVLGANTNHVGVLKFPDGSTQTNAGVSTSIGVTNGSALSVLDLTQGGGGTISNIAGIAIDGGLRIVGGTISSAGYGQIFEQTWFQDAAGHQMLTLRDIPATTIKAYQLRRTVSGGASSETVYDWSNATFAVDHTFQGALIVSNGLTVASNGTMSVAVPAKFDTNLAVKVAVVPSTIAGYVSLYVDSQTNLYALLPNGTSALLGGASNSVPLLTTILNGSYNGGGLAITNLDTVATEYIKASIVNNQIRMQFLTASSKLFYTNAGTSFIECGTVSGNPFATLLYGRGANFLVLNHNNGIFGLYLTNGTSKLIDFITGAISNSTQVTASEITTPDTGLPANGVGIHSGSSVKSPKVQTAIVEATGPDTSIQQRLNASQLTAKSWTNDTKVVMSSNVTHKATSKIIVNAPIESGAADTRPSFDVPNAKWVSATNKHQIIDAQFGYTNKTLTTVVSTNLPPAGTITPNQIFTNLAAERTFFACNVTASSASGAPALAQLHEITGGGDTPMGQCGIVGDALLATTTNNCTIYGMLKPGRVYTVSNMTANANVTLTHIGGLKF